MISITLDNITYINGEYILEEAKIYSKGSRSTRNLIKNKKIDNSMFIYAKLKNNEWIKTEGKSAKFDKVFFKQDFVIKIPEINDKNGDIIKDDKGIEQAPEIIELEDSQKFKDENNKSIEIETRGERNCDKVYFKVKDIMKGFSLENLNISILDKKNNSFVLNIDYKYFNCVIGKKKVKKELFLTYSGLRRCLHFKKDCRTKEKNIIDNILNSYKEYNWIHNKQLKCGFRPDMLTKINNKLTLLIEIDEHQHKNYNPSKDDKRTKSIFEEIKTKNIVMIRINPDEYKDKKNLYHEPINKSNEEFNKRVNIIIETIKAEIEKKNNDKSTNIIKLFYDEFDIENFEILNSKMYKYESNKNFEHINNIFSKLFADEDSFILQFGDKKQKEDLALKLLDYDKNILQNKFIPNCVYLYLIGNANKLLGENYSENDLLCKYGCTEDLPRRCQEHTKKFSKEFNCDIEMICFSIIEAKYIFNAESNIKQYFKSNLIEYKNMSELITINKSDIGQIKQHYSLIQNSYIGRYEEMNEKIKQFEKEIIELNNKLKLKEKDNEITIMKYEHELKNKELELKNKDIELLNYKVKLLEKNNK